MSRGAFTLLELVVVIIIIGAITAIAIPRMSRGTHGAADATTQAGLRELSVALEIYLAQNEGRDPAIKPDGTYDNNGDNFGARLVDNGYLKSIPYNPGTRQSCIRLTNIDSPTAECAWRYNSQIQTFLDDTP